MLAHALNDRTVAKAIRDQVAVKAASQTATEVRDLFERFLPESQRTRRLGTVVKPDELLALAGDAERGRKLFLRESSVNCKACHRIGNVGETLGPELTEIAKKLTRAQLLEAILEPSRQIDPKYVSYVLETADGEILSGLLHQKDEQEVVLKNADNKLIRVKADRVALIVPSSKSVMPELLLRDMTAQQVADLLAFLSSLK
jgi:putative heme-binding domain-containing protein